MLRGQFGSTCAAISTNVLDTELVFVFESPESDVDCEVSLVLEGAVAVSGVDGETDEVAPAEAARLLWSEAKSSDFCRFVATSCQY